MKTDQPENKPMAFQAKKTEHSGSKKGRGAYWGPKRDAKRESNRRRQTRRFCTANSDADYFKNKVFGQKFG